MMRPARNQGPSPRIARRALLVLSPLTMAFLWFANLPKVVLPPDPVRLEAELNGLDCAFWCPVGVEAVLATLPGLRVDRVDVNVGRVVVAFDPARIDAETVVRKLATKWTVRSAVRIDPSSGSSVPVALPISLPLDPRPADNSQAVGSGRNGIRSGA